MFYFLNPTENTSCCIQLRVILYTPRRQKKLFLFCGDTATGLIHRFYVAGDKKNPAFTTQKKMRCVLFCVVIVLLLFKLSSTVLYCPFFCLFLSPATQKKFCKRLQQCTQQQQQSSRAAVQYSTSSSSSSSSTAQYSTVQYSTVQHSTVQYSTVQYSIYSTVGKNQFKTNCLSAT